MKNSKQEARPPDASLAQLRERAAMPFANDAEPVLLKVDVIVATGGGPASAIKSANNTIPVVVTAAQDAVASGLVASLARPGGNVTGLSALGPELLHRNE